MSSGMRLFWRKRANDMALDREFDQASAAHIGISDAMAAFPAVITDARQAAGLSQRMLAKRCGFQRTYISKLENGHTAPTIISLMRLAGGLRMTASELLGRAEGKNSAVVKRRQEIGRLLGTIPPAVNLEVQKNGQV